MLGVLILESRRCLLFTDHCFVYKYISVHSSQMQTFASDLFISIYLIVLSSDPKSIAQAKVSECI